MPYTYQLGGKTYIANDDGTVSEAPVIQQGAPLDASYTPTGAALPAAPAAPASQTAQPQSGGTGGYSGGTQKSSHGYRTSAPSYGGGRSYGGGGYDYGTADPQYADGTYPGQSRDLAGLGDRIRGNVGDNGYDNRQQVYVPGGAAAGPFKTAAASDGTYGADRAFTSSGHSYGGGGGGAVRGMIGDIRSRVMGRLGGGGGSSYGGSSSYANSYSGGSSSYQPYEAPPPDPLLTATTQMGAEQMLLSTQLAGLPAETQAKYQAYGNVLMAKWAKKAMKHPEQIQAGKKPISKYVGRRLMR